jgi:thioredoxin:protein disulfide reductase
MMYRSAIRHIPGLLALLLAFGSPVGAQPATAAGGAAAAPSAPATGIDAVLKAGKSGEDSFLPVEQAFRFEAVAEGSDRLRLDWQIAEGYYLYRSRIKITSSSAAAQLGAPQFPAGQIKNDEYFGRQEIYHHELTLAVPVARAKGGALQLPLQVSYQGCAEAGLCYPPQVKTLTLSLSAASAGSSAGQPPAANSGEGGSEQGWYAGLIRGDSVWAMLGWFYLTGLGLAFTPCVLPMVPILSGIIVGSGRNVTTARAFTLSLAYVLGMALTYTAAGVACAAAGRQVQAMFEQWWVIALFAALFVALGLSMLGLFTLQMPAGVQSRIATLSNRQSAGTLGGVTMMGALSALIVTTCVAPALVGALLVISQTGQMVRGGAALFALAFGMGTPLLVVGASAGKLLPKAGAWMDLVKQVFGVLMLAVAVWMLGRIVPERLALLLWAVPALLLAWLLLARTRGRTLLTWSARAVGVAAAFYGVALAAGAALGGTDPLEPIPAFASHAPTLVFRPIHSLADLDREVAAAKAHDESVLVDFSADWCTSCKEMERYTFTDPQVQAALSHTVLLRADVTANNDDDQALLKRFGIFGPPTIAFYGSDGQERTGYRVVGYMKAQAFAERTRAALRTPS